METRKAIGVHHTATDDGAWDGPGNVAKLRADGTESYYRSAFAWQDPEKDAATKAAYKFPHHFVDGDGKVGPASIRGAIAGIAVLNGGRGGSSIPDEDRAGVHRHLAAHLADAGVDVPTLKRSDELGRPERRYIAGSELRVMDGANGPTIEGHAAVFDQLSVPLGLFTQFREKIRPGAFKKTITEADVRALYNHDPNFVLGRTKSGTLELREDDRGLFYKNTPPDTQWARDLVTTIRRGDVAESSFQFDTVRDEWEFHRDTKEVTRTLVEVRLFDVSPVTFPAYPQTDVQARHLESIDVSLAEFADAFARARAGEQLDTAARAILESVSCALASFPVAPAAAASAASHPAGDVERAAVARSGNLRRRLELAERL